MRDDAKAHGPYTWGRAESKAGFVPAAASPIWHCKVASRCSRLHSLTAFSAAREDRAAQPGRTELKPRRPCVVVGFSSWGRAVTYLGRCPSSFFTFHLKSWQFLAFKGRIIATFKIADSENLNDCLKMMPWPAQTYSIRIIAHTADTYITEVSRIHLFCFLFSFAVFFCRVTLHSSSQRTLWNVSFIFPQHAQT